MFILFQSIVLIEGRGQSPLIQAAYGEAYSDCQWMPLGESYGDRSGEFGTWSLLGYPGVWRYRTSSRRDWWF